MSVFTANTLLVHQPQTPMTRVRGEKHRRQHLKKLFQPKEVVSRPAIKTAFSSALTGRDLGCTWCFHWLLNTKWYANFIYDVCGDFILKSLTYLDHICLKKKTFHKVYTIFICVYFMYRLYYIYSWKCMIFRLLWNHIFFIKFS